MSRKHISDSLKSLSSLKSVSSESEKIQQERKGRIVAPIKRFEDIHAWQKARELTKMIYRETENIPFAKDYPLKDQTRRSSTSIVLKIAEGFGRKTDKEFMQFLVQAHDSSAELQAALYVALDQEYIREEMFTNLYESADEISKMIMGLYNYLAGRK